MTKIVGALVALSVALAVIGPAVLHPGVASAQEIYGSQIMTEQERMDYRTKMQNAKTEEERERIRLENHAAMQARAKQMGITLPDVPPTQGMGQGMGMGMGQGMGMDQGMGQGQGQGQGQGMGN